MGFFAESSEQYADIATSERKWSFLSSCTMDTKVLQNFPARNVRETALDVLHHVFRHPEDGTPVPVLLRDAAALLNDCDVPLLSELVYGVLRRSMLLDAVLRRYLRRPAAISPWVTMLLRMGALELLFLDGIPERATVHEMVGIVRRRFGQGLSGLVNAVLRSLARDRDTVRENLASGKDSLATLAEEASLPFWLVQLWEKQYGTEQAMDFARNARSAPAPCWRVNALRQGKDVLLDAWRKRGYPQFGELGFTAQGLAGGRETRDAERALLDELEGQGAITRQGATSQLVVQDVARWIREHSDLGDDPLWDACCGRGGKTMALMEQGVRVSLASDPSARRIEDLRAGVQRLGLDMPRVLCSSAQEIDGEFRLILLDVPCSGTGTLGRVPELRVRLNLERLEEALRLQRDILESVWRRLACGGLVFYVTCALNMEENEWQVEHFVKAHGDATNVFQKWYLPPFPGQDTMFLAVLEKASFL